MILQEVKDLGNPVKDIMNSIKRIVDEEVVFSSLSFFASNSEKLYTLRYDARRLDYYILYYLERPREGLELKK